MLNGVMLLWFILTGMSVLFVVVDIRTTPEAVVLKWGFVILTLFTGPFGAFFYLLGCREPLPGTHEQYVSATWRQVLGSTMHCAAGDGLGIIAGAAISNLLELPPALDITLEYVLGFGFGWAFFQAYAMRDMAGGDYRKSLKMTFIPEFYSMNILMAGMLLVTKFWMPGVEGANNPFGAAFWFIMSLALLVGFIFAYPMNWWLVTRHLKHGMMTVRANPHSMHVMKKRVKDVTGGADKAGMQEMTGMDHQDTSGEDDMANMQHPNNDKPGNPQIIGVGAFSIVVFAISLLIVFTLGPD
ncbi:MAG: DUF4396 domain-containing protein [Gammaproteobacteria bacterium]|nr:DUF4396 domain-containing protein [Gammaproteobacteria bacterium]MCP4089219.1 DUF4396 domain-containing protein [Gammaproteobacteria bacterium]MCP4276757.1 DUF4396 domain-containing protein [Gammaproteobacteria bacterium]MCP4830600.1 DUF4396 domain-containing protein [Gammaproteobacteria bacterium]MCP4928409.1 DUF4396 domain-containing protein [Gammaproteobacteria bacterium]